MKKQAASEDKLGTIHSLMADFFLHQLNTEIKGINEAKENDEEHFSTLNPAMITAMLKYLDASKITCVLDEDDKQSEMAIKLKAIKDKRNNILDISNINKAVNED